MFLPVMAWRKFSANCRYTKGSYGEAIPLSFAAFAAGLAYDRPPEKHKRFATSDAQKLAT
jgi:hypothetical protein